MFYQVCLVVFLVLFTVFLSLCFMFYKKFAQCVKVIPSVITDIVDITLRAKADYADYFNSDDDDIEIENEDEDDDNDIDEYVEDKEFDVDDTSTVEDMSKELTYIDELKQQLKEIPDNSIAHKELSTKIKQYENMVGLGIHFLG